MTEFPPPWDAYVRMQEALAHTPHIDDHAWGLEAALNRLLDDLPPPADIDRTVRSESRKERRRMTLRRTILTEDFTILSPEPEAAIDARGALEQLQRQVTTQEWGLLRDIADGYSYEELSVVDATTPGSLRVRVYRLRRALRPAVQEVLNLLVAV